MTIRLIFRTRFLTLVLLCCAAACEVPVETDPANKVDTPDFSVGDLFPASWYANSTILNEPVHLSMASDGAHVYAVVRATDSIAWFSRNALSGAVTYRSSYTDPVGLNMPYFAVVSPDGDFVYATSGAGAAVTWFSRDPATGDLSFLGSYDNEETITSASHISFSPDGFFIYVTGAASLPSIRNVIAWFARNPATGSLTFLSQVDGPENNSYFIAVSPDGGHVYTTAKGTSGSPACITWFARHPATGNLTYNGRYTGTLIHGADNIVLSDDARFLYVSAHYADTVVCFARDPHSGGLTLEDYETIDSAPLIRNPSPLILSPDQRNLYVGSAAENSITWFARSRATGRLVFMGQYSGTISNFPVSLCVSPDGSRLYVLGFSTARIGWFGRDNN